MPIRQVINTALALAMLTSSTAPFAAATDPDSPLHYILRIGMEHTDNVYLTPNGQVSDDIFDPRLDFDYQREGSAFDIRAAGTLEQHIYLGGSFSGDSRNEFAGIGSWHILPQRLDWVFEDFLGVAPIDTQANDTAANLQEANVFVTGPTLRARFSGRLNGELDLRYARSDASTTSEFDGDRLAATGRLLYLLSSNSTIGLNLASQQARYDSAPTDREYNRDDAYVSWNFTGVRTSLTADVGYTWLEFLGGGPSPAASFARLSAAFKVTPSLTIVGELERDYTDAADSMRLTTEQIGVVPTSTGLSRISITPDVYYQKFAYLDVRYKTDLWDLRIGPYWRQVRYVTPDPLGYDQDDSGVLALVDYRLSPILTLSGKARYERRDYTAIARRDIEREYSAWLMWQFTRRWAWRFELTRLEQSTTAIDLSYRENRIGVNLIYAR